MTNKVIIQFWVNGELESEYEHIERRHPSLGWHPMNIIEAKLDGAQQHLVRKNYKMCKKRLGEALNMLRRLIVRRKKQGYPLDKRCEYITKQYENDNSTKCDKYPVTEYKGIYFCKSHLVRYKEEWIRARSVLR